MATRTIDFGGISDVPLLSEHFYHGENAAIRTYGFRTVSNEAFLEALRMAWFDSTVVGVSIVGVPLNATVDDVYESSCDGHLDVSLTIV